jgi:adenylate kinase
MGSKTERRAKRRAQTKAKKKKAKQAKTIMKAEKQKVERRENMPKNPLPHQRSLARGTIKRLTQRMKSTMTITSREAT